MEVALYLALAMFSAVCYYPALQGDFVFDDSEAILSNDDIDPSLSSWSDVFAHDFWGDPINSSTSHKSYRPLTILSFQLDFLIGGGKRNPFVYHVTNIILHSVVVVLFVLVTEEVQQMTFTLVEAAAGCSGSRKFLPLAAGLLFASHPVHTENASL